MLIQSCRSKLLEATSHWEKKEQIPIKGTSSKEQPPGILQIADVTQQGESEPLLQ